MPQPHVQVVLGGSTVPATLEAALRRTNASVSFHPITEALRPGGTLCADAVVVVASRNSDVSDRLKLLFDRLADHPRATLVLHDGERDAKWSRFPESLPVSFETTTSEDSLTTRLATMLDMRRSLEALHRGTIANEASQRSASKRYKDQLRLASKVQREFLPQELPRFGSISFSALYRPAEYVSGDIYDIQRLDEDHVGIAVADATGEGIPAALLTVFIKRALNGKDIRDNKYRIIEPDEVLRRLNSEILDANLSECRFIAATYALLNIRTREIVVSRGGAPYPIVRNADGTARFLRPPGGVIGVMPDAAFGIEKAQLSRGDAVVLLSDGVEHLITPHAGISALADTFLAAATAAGGGGPAPADRNGGAPLATRETEKPRAASVGFSRNAGLANVDLPLKSDAVERGPQAVWGLRRNGHARSRLSTPLDEAARGTQAPDELIAGTAWFATLKDRGVRAAFEEFNARHNALRRIGQKLDDVTMVAIHVDE